MAIAFAGGMLNSQLPALTESLESTVSVINRIENSTEVPPEVRAFYLLSLARGYLTTGDKDTVEAQYTPDLIQSRRPFLRRGWEPILVPWADQASIEARSQSSGINLKTEAKTDSQLIPKENLVLANVAIRTALTHLDRTSDKFAKLNMYFIASRLYRKSGNTAGVWICNKVLENAFHACEDSSQIDEKEIKAVSSVLNSMAYDLIPVHIEDRNPYGKPWGRQTQVQPFTEKDFEASQKLRLRAVAMVDRLASNNHVRRMAHRDFALWYMQLGKMDMAEKEKQVLFELVGCNDDSILYPQYGACGHLIWWQKEHTIVTITCGMG